MNTSQKQKMLKTRLGFRPVLTLLLIFFTVMVFSTQSQARSGILIVHTSQSKNPLIAKALAESLDGTLLEIRALKKRSGITGYFSTKSDVWFDRDTPIDPLHPDLAPYPLVVIVSSVKKGQLETPIRTLMRKNNLKDNMLLMVTNSKQDIKRYDSYDDDASYWKRRARNKVRKWRKKSLKFSEESGAKVIGHVHLATTGQTDGDLEKMAADIFNFKSEYPPEWLFKTDDLPTWILANTELKNN